MCPSLFSDDVGLEQGPGKSVLLLLSYLFLTPLALGSGTFSVVEGRTNGTRESLALTC